jgi:hypothetical protein
MSNVNITIKIDRQGGKNDETYTWLDQSTANLSAIQHSVASLFLHLANWGEIINTGHAAKPNGPKDSKLGLSMVVTHTDGSKHSYVVAGYDNIQVVAVEQIVAATRQALAPFLPSAAKS